MSIGTEKERVIPPAIAQEAGMWDARLRAPDCTDDDRLRFVAWRDADAAHLEAFERLQAFVATLRAERGRAGIRALRDEALRAAQQRYQRRKLWISAAAAGFIALLLGAVLWTNPAGELLRRPATELVARLSGVRTYSTGTGQRSALVLEDGSSVELNAQSSIKVHFTESQRHVELEQGQALFNVAKHSRRPFVVSAAGRQIVAVGTQFDVRLDHRSVQVTLIEGKVRVEKNSDNASTNAKADDIELTPGKQLVAMLPTSRGTESGRGQASTASKTEPPAVVRDIDVVKVMGWREGRIFLDDVSLEDAVKEMNKYSAVQISIEGAALADIHVNGMFKAGEQASFVAALEEYFPISAHTRGDREIVLTAR